MLHSYQTGMTDTSWIGTGGSGAADGRLPGAVLAGVCARCRRLSAMRAPRRISRSRAARSADSSVPLGSRAAGEGDPRSGPCRGWRTLSSSGDSAPSRSSRSITSRPDLALRFLIAPAARFGRLLFRLRGRLGRAGGRFPSPDCPCAASWCGPFGSARSRRNRASLRCSSSS